MSQAPEQTVAWLHKHLQPATDPSAEKISAEKIKELIAKLDSAAFKTREQATHELLQLGEAAEPVLHEISKVASSVEARLRTDDLLNKLREKRTKGPATLSGEALRQVRAVEVLERIGTPESAELLARLAEGAPYSPLTRQSEASRQRLETSSNAMQQK